MRRRVLLSLVAISSIANGADEYREFIRDDSSEIVTYNSNIDTLLMWQDNEEAATIQKPWVTDENYNAGNYSDTSGDTASTYCSNLELGGYSDWRLPNIDELKSIVDSDNSPTIVDGFNNIVASGYWSSSDYVNYSRDAWNVVFYYGYDFYNRKSSDYYVRCVRTNSHLDNLTIIGDNSYDLNSFKNLVEGDYTLSAIADDFSVTLDGELISSGDTMSLEESAHNIMVGDSKYSDSNEFLGVFGSSFKFNIWEEGSCGLLQNDKFEPKPNESDFEKGEFETTEQFEERIGLSAWEDEISQYAKECTFKGVMSSYSADSEGVTVKYQVPLVGLDYTKSSYTSLSLADAPSIYEEGKEVKLHFLIKYSSDEEFYIDGLEDRENGLYYKQFTTPEPVVCSDTEVEINGVCKSESDISTPTPIITDEIKEYCSLNPSECGVAIGELKYTDSDLIAKESEIKSLCQTNPSECGITLNSATPMGLIDKTYIDGLSSGWHILGDSLAISDMSIFDTALIIWSYDSSNSSWSAYSKDYNKAQLILNNHIDVIDNIPANQGFWVYK